MIRTVEDFVSKINQLNKKGVVYRAHGKESFKLIPGIGRYLDKSTERGFNLKGCGVKSCLLPKSTTQALTIFTYMTLFTYTKYSSASYKNGGLYKDIVHSIVTDIRSRCVK